MFRSERRYMFMRKRELGGILVFASQIRYLL